MKVKGAFQYCAYTPLTTEPLPERLQRSRFNTPEDLVSFSQGFDEGVKKVFSMSNYHASHYVRFISPRGLGTKGGMLAFTGYTHVIPLMN